MMETFQVNEAFTRLLRRWHWTILAAVFGGLAGLVFSLLIPPRYEASAALAVSIDYGRVEPLELVIADRILDRVWQLIVSDDTLDRTRARLLADQGEGRAWESVETLRDHLRLDARLSRWEFIGIDSDPSLASDIANAWYETSLDQLDIAYDHAWKALELQDELFEITCVELLTGEHPESLWQCLSTGPDIPAEDIEAIKREVIASRGVMAIIQYDPLERARPPQDPVLWPRGLVIFAGAAVAFVLGLIAAILSQSRDVALDPETERVVER